MMTICTLETKFLKVSKYTIMNKLLSPPSRQNMGNICWLVIISMNTSILVNLAVLIWPCISAPQVCVCVQIYTYIYMYSHFYMSFTHNTYAHAHTDTQTCTHTCTVSLHTTIRDSFAKCATRLNSITKLYFPSHHINGVLWQNAAHATLWTDSAVFYLLAGDR